MVAGFVDEAFIGEGIVCHPSIVRTDGMPSTCFFGLPLPKIPRPLVAHHCSGELNQARRVVHYMDGVCPAIAQCYFSEV